MAIQQDSFADFVKATLKDLGKLKQTNLMSDLQYTVAMAKMWKEGRDNFQSGAAIQFNAVMDHNHSAKAVGLMEPNELNMSDAIVQGSVPWRHVKASYGWEEHLIDMNREPSKVVDMIAVERARGAQSQVEKAEEHWWGMPDAGTNAVKPFGVQYWLTYSATEGFNGGNPSGFSDGKAGISATTYPRWRNWTAQYSALTEADVVTKLQTAMWSCQFKPAPNVKLADYSTGPSRYGIYTTYTNLQALQRLVQTRNDNLGTDLVYKEGQVLLNRVDIEAVPYLQQNQNTTCCPFVGIDWSVFKACFLNRWYLRETGPELVSGYNALWQVIIDTTYNTVCRDLRKQFLVSKATWE